MASTVVVGDVHRDFVFAGVGNGTACMYVCNARVIYQGVRCILVSCKVPVGI